MWLPFGFGFAGHTKGQLHIRLISKELPVLEQYKTPLTCKKKDSTQCPNVVQVYQYEPEDFVSIRCPVL